MQLPVVLFVIVLALIVSAKDKDAEKAVAKKNEEKVGTSAAKDGKNAKKAETTAAKTGIDAGKVGTTTAEKTKENVGTTAVKDEKNTEKAEAGVPKTGKNTVEKDGKNAGKAGTTVEKTGKGVEKPETTVAKDGKNTEKVGSSAPKDGKNTKETVTAAAKGGITCPGGSLTSEQRQRLLGQHNALRSALAKGFVRNKDGIAMPKAKNMLKLNYSCELEQEIQGWADKCTPKLPRGANGIKIIYGRRFRKRKPVPAVRIEVKRWWWDQVKKLPNNPSNIVTLKAFDLRAGNFIQMAWGKAYAVGCAINPNCATKDGRRHFAVVICLYNPRRIRIGKPLYELGNPCKEDTDCSSKKCSTEDGLCIKQ